MSDTEMMGRRVHVTDVRITPARDQNEKLRAFATITLDDCFVVRGVKVIQVPRGLMVAMPSRRKPDGSFQDLAHPIHAEARAELEGAVLSAYHEWQSRSAT
jgi:stage V sporulation protein G